MLRILPTDIFVYLLLAAVIAFILDHYGASQYHLIGHSMGGFIALKTALAQQQRIARGAGQQLVERAVVERERLLVAAAGR